ncbi:MAG: nucleotidyltransferase domain-containing protein [Methanomassiliicoccaceae archaeon]|nr:nucleotidyltransferase domain-containing protein [Methanomassiliicoccaceae archaeon]
MGSADAGGGLPFERLREVVAPIAAEHGITRVCLFGSRARGDYHEGSDYDFCIAVPDDYDLFDIGGFLYDLKEAVGGNVHIVCEDSALKRPSLMEEILRDGKIVFEA